MVEILVFLLFLTLVGISHLAVYNFILDDC
jgi:hypothetical protein